MIKSIQLIILLLTVFSCRTLAQQAGDPDPSFGSYGIRLTDFGTNDDNATSLVIQPDGKIIAAGKAGADFALARYNTDGTLDNSFGSNGKVINSFSINGDAATCVLLQPDGKIVIGGTTYNVNSTLTDFAIMRYNSDGSVDTGFGTSGIDTCDFEHYNDDVLSIALQPDGKIVAGGAASSIYFGLARFNADGALDQTFGTNGKVLSNLNGGGNERIYAVAIQPDGKILAAGDCDNFAGDSIALSRYNSDGTLDNTFGNGGTALTKLSESPYNDLAKAMALLPDGKILVGAVSQWDFAVLRYNSNGSLDSTFGTNGSQTTDFNTSDDQLFSMAVQPDGKIVVAGYVWNYPDDTRFGLVRYNADGSIDNTFGANGKVTTNFYYDGDGAYAIAVQPDGKSIAAGYVVSNGNFDFALARYIAYCVQTIFYADADSDGYGIFSDTVHACLAPAGYVQYGNDCNDADPNVNPDIVEVNGNGIDDNCNGYTDEVCADSFYLVADPYVASHYWGVSSVSGLSPYHYYWSWGDGAFDTIQYPSHTYQGGYYEICLFVVDSLNCYSEFCSVYLLTKLSSASESNYIAIVDIVDSIPGIPTMVSDENVLQAVTVFPNPVANDAHVFYSLSTPSDVTISIFDLPGKMLRQELYENQDAGEYQRTIDLQEMPGGIFVLQISAGDQIELRKIVVIK